MESLNHYPNWLKKINIDIDKLLIDRGYIDFFMQMYIQWSKDGSSTSSFRKLIIPHLSRFEKLDFSLFKLYIETQKMTQCFVSCNFQKTILVWSAEGREFFCILQTLRIHTGLWKLSKTNVYGLHVFKMNPFDIFKPCINIANSECLFEQYRMALNQENMILRFEMMMQ